MLLEKKFSKKKILFHQKFSYKNNIYIAFQKMIQIIFYSFLKYFLKCFISRNYLLVILIVGIFPFKIFAQDSVHNENFSCVILIPKGYSQKLQEQVNFAYQQISNKVQKNLRIELHEYPIISLCENHKEMEKAAGSSIVDWAFGVALPQKYLIAINLQKVSSPENALSAVVRHETVHLYLGAWENIHQKNLPLWFNEGIAEYFSGALHLTYQEEILNSLAFQKVIPFESLNNKFPKDSQLAHQAYLQSLSMVRYIQSHYGNSALRNILQHYEHSKNFNEALEKALEIDLEKLQQNWYVAISPGNLWLWIWRITGIFSLFTIVAFLVLLAYWKQKRRNQKLLTTWQHQEKLQESTTNNIIYMSDFKKNESDIPSNLHNIIENEEYISTNQLQQESDELEQNKNLLREQKWRQRLFGSVISLPLDRETRFIEKIALDSSSKKEEQNNASKEEAKQEF